ncbi:MAG: YfcE family phosphodiesterase [Halobacteriaceae archaeon]
MLVGVVSDTHDNVAAAEAAADAFAHRDVETVVHCGDVVAPPTVSAFEGFDLHAVLGNNDGEVRGLDAAIDGLSEGSELHGRFADLELGGARFAVLHGESLAEVAAVAGGDYEFVCYGHHHEREEREVDGTTVLNPGAHFPTVPDEHRTVAVVDTDEGTVEFLDL